MQLRLFFPLWSMATLIGEIASAHRQEVNKLRKFGNSYLVPYIHSRKFTKYPFKLTITFYIFSDIDTTSLIILSSYILNELKIYSLQSADYRVVSSFELKTTKISNKKNEGCEIVLESLRKEQH